MDKKKWKKPEIFETSDEAIERFDKEFLRRHVLLGNVYFNHRLEFFDRIKLPLDDGKTLNRGDLKIMLPRYAKKALIATANLI